MSVIYSGVDSVGDLFKKYRLSIQEVSVIYSRSVGDLFNESRQSIQEVSVIYSMSLGNLFNESRQSIQEVSVIHSGVDSVGDIFRKYR